jgi:hypothetical protein
VFDYEGESIEKMRIGDMNLEPEMDEENKLFVSN